jgi:hypothetical protein
MKRYSLLLLPLVAVVFAVSCRDTTSPAGSHALLALRNPNPDVIGNKPPPPVDAAINIEVSSVIEVAGAFNGVYFADGTSVESGLAAQSFDDPELTFTGTAWLRLDNVQPKELGTMASANARFQRTQQNPDGTGRGTLEIEGVTVRIDRVTSFKANPSCEPLQLCAEIVFDASILVNGVFEPGHSGHVQAFKRTPDCSLDGIYYCPLPPPPIE